MRVHAAQVGEQAQQRDLAARKPRHVIEEYDPGPFVSLACGKPSVEARGGARRLSASRIARRDAEPLCGSAGLPLLLPGCGEQARRCRRRARPARYPASSPPPGGRPRRSRCSVFRKPPPPARPDRIPRRPGSARSRHRHSGRRRSALRLTPCPSPERDRQAAGGSRARSAVRAMDRRRGAAASSRLAVPPGAPMRRADCRYPCAARAVARKSPQTPKGPHPVASEHSLGRRV